MKFTNSPYETMMQQVPRYEQPEPVKDPEGAPRPGRHRLPLLAGDRVRGLLPGATERRWRREVKRWPES